MYEIEFSKEAVKHVLLMRKSSPQLFRKLEKLLDELREHPYTGTGHPEQLRYLEGVWSRQLDKKNRIRYMVNETTVIVFIISAWGHYDYPIKRLHSSGVLVHPLAVRRSPTDEFFVLFRTCSVVRFCWVILLCTGCAVFVGVSVCGIGSISPRPLC